MKAIEYHNKLNKHLASREKRTVSFYEKAIFMLSELNRLRKIEGIGTLTLPNIEKKYIELTA